MNTGRKRLSQLFFPLFFEILCMMLTGAVDTLMLATEGDQAVGAVGTANSYISIFTILFTVISSGMVAVMTQYIGAGRPGVARQTLKLGILVNLTTGAVVSAVLYLGGGAILRLLGTAEGLFAPGQTYLRTVGAFCLFSALIPILSSYLQAFGHTTPCLFGTLLSNLLNLGLNALFLFGFHWGVFGVALATGLSRVAHLLWLAGSARIMVHQASDAQPPKNRLLLGKILRVGFPAAMESTLYNLAITIVISLLNRMDAEGVQATARTYAMLLANFSFCAGAALAHANAIIVGWHIGAGELEECQRETHRAAILGICIGVAIAGVTALCSKYLLRLFTSDPGMIRLVGYLLIVDIFLEIGRVSNLVYGYALKTSGDATYPMLVAVTFAFLCAAGGTWLFGVKLGWLAVGAYIAMALDECVRAVFMCHRWRSGIWKTKKLVQAK